MYILLILGLGVIVVVLVRIFLGAMNVTAVETQSLADVERKHPYLPRLSVIAGGVGIFVLLVLFTLMRGNNALVESVRGQFSVSRTVFVFIVIAAFGLFDQWKWRGSKDRYKYFFAFILGTVVTWVLIAFKRGMFETGIQQDPFLMALGVTCIVVGWRFLFGPWSASIKATVLGTFLFWVSYAILRHKTGVEVLATAIATVVALVPVAVWCGLFLSYHRQRMSIVVLAFFAGMLSTVPILFYAALMQRGVELNFFLFKVVPLSYGGSSTSFVEQSVLFGGITGLRTAVIATLITYLIVGIIEEVSKYWVLRYSSAPFFRSIDDALQLSIIVAIGFAFAENLVNPTYYVGFVQNYLLVQNPMWGQFIGNVVGRAVLTNMVHILSTGVLGYFFGLAFFASPLLKERFSKGRVHPFIQWVHRLLDMKAETIFSRYKLTQGMLCAVLLHGIFDFVVSLPDILPGNPATIGALIGSSPGILHSISITFLPSILYVVGGCWLLVSLFARKEDMKEFGAVVETQTFVS